LRGLSQLINHLEKAIPLARSLRSANRDLAPGRSRGIKPSIKT
jgi:hypothetical protein